MLDARELLKASATGATVALGVASATTAGGAKTRQKGDVGDTDEEDPAASVYQHAATCVQRIVRGNAARYRAAKEQAAVAIQSVARGRAARATSPVLPGMQATQGSMAARLQTFLHATPRQLTSLSRNALASQANLLEESLRRTRAELEQREGGGGIAALDEATEFAARFRRERVTGVEE